MEREPMREMRNRNLRNIAFITIVVILGLILLQSWFGRSDGGSEITYTQFIEIVERGGVASVYIREDVAQATVRPLVEAEITLSVENRSDGVLTLVALSNDRYGDLASLGTLDLPADLLPGEAFTGSLEVPVYGEAFDRDPGVTTATLLDEAGGTVTVSDASPTVALLTEPASVEKTEVDLGHIDPGGEIEARLPADTSSTTSSSTRTWRAWSTHRPPPAASS